MVDHSNPGGIPGGNFSTHGDSVNQREGGGEKQKPAALDLPPVTGVEFSRAEQARTNASDGSLRNFSQTSVDAQEGSIELVGFGRSVSRTQPGTEKNLLESPAPLAQKSDTQTLTRAAAEKSLTNLEVGKRTGDLSHISPEFKALTGEAAAQIKDANCLHYFTRYLDDFQHQSKLPQEEKNRTYVQLSRLLGEKISKLEPFDKASCSALEWTPEVDAAKNLELRAVLATQLLYHAANPRNIDQGNFLTCNVTTQAERLFARHPSKAAEIAVTAALESQWPDAKSKTEPKIIIDRRCLRPTEGVNSTAIPPVDGVRTFAVQLLNVVMVNDITQRLNPPRFYIQQPKSTSLDPDTRASVKNSGEALMVKDAKDQHKLVPWKRTVMTRHGSVEVPVESPQLKDAKLIADMAARMSGEKDYLIVPDPPDRDPHTGKPIADGLVHVDSPDKMREALQLMKAQGRLPATVVVDCGAPLFNKDGSKESHSGHVVSVWDIDKDGLVKISNQWGKLSDINASVNDLYDACESMAKIHEKPGMFDDAFHYFSRWKFEHFNVVKQDGEK